MTDDTTPKLSSRIPGLKALLAWAEAHPDLPAPWEIKVDYNLWGDENVKDTIAQVVRSVSKTEKYFASSYFALKHTFGVGVRLDVFCDRAKVCERKVVGTRIVPARSTPEHTEEIVEWDCHSILEPENSK